MRGHTLLELLIVVTLVGMVSAVLVPRIGPFRDRAAVHRASGRVAAFYTRARLQAIFTGRRVRITFDEDSLTAVTEGRRDSTVLAWAGPARAGVGLRASRRTIRVHPTGVGAGAANTKLVLTRGAAAESLTTSRLGRLKRWR